MSFSGSDSTKQQYKKLNIQVYGKLKLRLDNIIKNSYYAQGSIF